METSEKVKHILPLEMTPPLVPVLVTTEEGLRAVESFLERTSVYGFDLETNVTDTFYNRVIRTIQLGDKQEQYVIDLLAFAGEAGLAAEQGQYGKRLSPGLLRVKQLLQRRLEDASRTKVGQGLQFESEMMLWNFGIRVKGYYDTLLAEKNIYAGLVHFMTKGFWGLEDLVLRYTGLTMSKDEQKNFDLTTPLTQNQVDYCGLDVRLPLAVRNGQLRILEKDELMWAAQIEFNAVPAFADMHLSGIYLDPDPWREIINERLMMRSLVISAMDAKLLPVVGAKYVTEAELERRDALEKQWRDCPNKTAEDRAQRAELRKAFMVLRKSIAERVKEKDSCIGEAAINYSSPAQIRDAFWQLGYTKKEFPKTDDRTLEKLAKYPNLTIEKAFANPASLIGDLLTSKYVGYLATLPIVDLLRLFRSIEKSITTYGHTWIITQDETWGKKKSRGVVSPFTGRIHSDINQFGAATGRTSSSDPNIQNIPKGSKYRHCFRARPGYKLLTVDYSGCELRILAELSGEKVWLDAFKNAWDVHSVGAEIMFGQRWKDGAADGCKYVSGHLKCKCPIHEDLRNKIKAINFGIAYGMMAKKLGDELGIPEAEAQKLLDLYYAAFPTVIAYLEKSGAHARNQLQQRTICGRRRRWNKPTWDSAKKLVLLDAEAERKKPADQQDSRKLNCTDRSVSWKLRTLAGNIEREGKNSPIQGANADVAKIAMALIWEELFPRFRAFFVNMVHDELVIECPEENAKECFKFVSEKMEEAGRQMLKLIPMTTEGNIENYWSK